MQGMDKRILFLQILRRHWLVLVVGYVLVIVDPFGIGSSTSKAISNAFDRMVSPFYSSHLAAGGEDSADVVDVILIDDHSIRTLSHEDNGYLTANDWPLAYSDHGLLIDALRRRGYGTVILDITFYRARSTDDSFDFLVTRLKHLRDNAGMSIILSAGSDPGELEPSIHPLVKAASGLGLAGWSGHGDAYPLEKVFPDGTSVLIPDGVAVPTLAVAGYRAYCERTKRSGCGGLPKAEEALLAPEPAGMHLKWGMPVEAERVARSLNCQSSESGLAWFELFFIAGRNMVGPETVNSEGLRVCPPVPTATMNDVFCTEPGCYPLSRDEETPRERIAIVGVSLPSARDLFDPPTPGRLPGVYLHAEALRNLLLHGADYVKPMGLSLSLESFGLPGRTLPLDLLVAWPALFIAVVCGVRASVNWRWGRGSPSGHSEWSELAMELFEILIVLFLLGIIYSVTLSVNRTPGSLAELIGLTPLLLIAIRKERKEMENERISSLGWLACSIKQPALGRDAVHHRLP